MTSEQIQPSVAPIGDIAGPAGYTAMSTASFANATRADITKAVAEVGKCLNNPLVLSKLTDRVYELLLEDLRNQRERVRNYGKQRWF